MDACTPRTTSSPSISRKCSFSPLPWSLRCTFYSCAFCTNNLRRRSSWRIRVFLMWSFLVRQLRYHNPLLRTKFCAIELFFLPYFKKYRNNARFLRCAASAVHNNKKTSLGRRILLFFILFSFCLFSFVFILVLILLRRFGSGFKVWITTRFLMDSRFAWSCTWSPKTATTLADGTSKKKCLGILFSFYTF